MVGHCDELAERSERGVDENGIAEIAERYPMEVVSPVPEGHR